MQQKQRKQAVIYAARLARAFGLGEEFVKHIAEGDVHYSVMMWEQQAGVMVNIDRNRSVFGLHIKEIEENTGIFVYHCILTGPFLTFLYVPNDPRQWAKVGPVVGSDEVCAYILDINELFWGQATIRLGSYDKVLIRLD